MLLMIVDLLFLQHKNSQPALVAPVSEIYTLYGRSSKYVDGRSNYKILYARITL